MPKKKKKGYAKYGYLFAMPFMIAYLIFSLYPTLYTMIIGFTDLKGIGKTSFRFLTEDIFANYRTILTSLHPAASFSAASHRMVHGQTL